MDLDPLPVLGDDGGLGVFGQHLRKIGGVGGQDRAFVAARQLDAAGGNGGQCRADAVALDRQRIHVLAARLSRGERGLHGEEQAGVRAGGRAHPTYGDGGAHVLLVPVPGVGHDGAPAGRDMMGP